MEGLSFLVSELLARHGVETEVDHRRLQWSNWFQCKSSFSALLVPSRPGIFALGEEVMAPEDIVSGGKRMLALFQISATDDLGIAMGRLFLPGTPVRERLLGGRCFARYAVVEDADQREAVCAALQQWMATSAEAALGAVNDFESRPFVWGNT